MTESHPFAADHGGGEPHLVREIMRAHQALVWSFSHQVGIPASLLAVLRLLAVHGDEDLGVLEIARRLGVNGAAITRLVQRMEAEGFVSRRAAPRDARRAVIELTADGHQLFREVHRRAHEFERALGEALSPEDVAAALRVLAHVRAEAEGARGSW